jgi:tetraacyldisaccharide 4'-kinase
LSAANTVDILREITTHFRTRFIYLLYWLALLAVLPLLPLYFARRVRRDRRYAHQFRERLGHLPFTIYPTPAGSIWLHAVSVGEVLSAISLVEHLRRLYSQAPIYVSCTTVAGRELAEAKLRDHVDGLFYAPLDYTRCVRRVLSALRPSLVVILETEIWPNLYREVKRSGAALAIVNGRMSDRAFPRYRAFRWFFRAPLSFPDVIHVQSAQDRDRYLTAGAPDGLVSIGGNLKFDFVPASGEVAAEVQEFIRALRPANIWIAASTMPPADSADVDEDDIVVNAFVELARARPGLLLIHVPRRPERFDVAAAKLQAAGLRFVRRSQLAAAPALTLPGVLLLDTIGELSRMFALADVVFMGGTLARRGGHNILEPACFGKPVIVGPHMENFAAIAVEFHAQKALKPIASGSELAAAVESLLRDGAGRAAIGERAQALAESKRGVAGSLAQSLLHLYDRALPGRGGSPLLRPFAALWGRGVERDRARSTALRLPAPVISIGNITAGGSGKTPMVEWLAARLHEHDIQPAILIRGYKRRTTDRLVVVKAGACCPVSRTGDEAQIYVRRAVAHVGIGGNRYETGSMIHNDFGAGAFILDDGFQHWPLARDLDVVLIDALDPFGGGVLIPRGRLREPLSALARAHAIVLTRTTPGLRTTGIEERIRRHNRHAPIFRSRVVPHAWVNHWTGEEFPPSGPPFSKVVAFCGLGNPAAFWNTLAEAAVPVAFRWQFVDHFSYRPKQIRRLVAQAKMRRSSAIVTTEKDAINMPPDLPAELRDVPLYWLRVGIEVEREPEFLALCIQAATRPGRAGWDGPGAATSSFRTDPRATP